MGQQRPASYQERQRPCAPANQPQTECGCNQQSQRSVQPSMVSHRPWEQMSKEQLLQWISMTKFACVDASLYLDTHPDDVEAIRYFQEHNRLYTEAMNVYAKVFGPLTIAHARYCDTYWDWVNQPWPWQ